MKFVKLAGISLFAGVAAFAASSALAQDSSSKPAQPAAQQPAAPQLTLDQILAAVRKERSEASAENKAREQRFLQDRNNQQAQLNQVKAQVAAAAAESTRLEGVMKANQDRIDKLDQDLAEKQGQFQELFGAARSAAADLTTQLQKSVISAEYPGRDKELQQIAQTDTLPTEDQLRFLWETMIQQIVEQGKVATFTANVAQPDGTSVSKEITRIGPFDAFSEGRYLVYNTEQNQLGFLARQPTGAVRDAARRVANYKGDGFARRNRSVARHAARPHRRGAEP